MFIFLTFLLFLSCSNGMEVKNDALYLNKVTKTIQSKCNIDLVPKYDYFMLYYEKCKKEGDYVSNLLKNMIGVWYEIFNDEELNIDSKVYPEIFSQSLEEIVDMHLPIVKEEKRNGNLVPNKYNEIRTKLEYRALSITMRSIIQRNNIIQPLSWYQRYDKDFGGKELVYDVVKRYWKSNIELLSKK